MKNILKLTVLAACFVFMAWVIPGYAAASTSGDDDAVVSPASPDGFLPAGGGISEVRITIIPVSAVSTASPNYLRNRTNVMNGLYGLAVPADRTITPEAYYPIGYFEWGDAMLTTGFASWRGLTQPTGAFAGERGNRLKWCVVVETKNGASFSANQVWFEITSTFTALNLVGNMGTNSANGNQIPLQFIMQGTHYGPNGVEGGGDDVVYNSDTSPASVTTPVHKVVYFGVTSQFTASDTPTLAANRAVALSPGFMITVRYYLKTGGETNGMASVTLFTAPMLGIRSLDGGQYALDILRGQPGVGYSFQSKLSVTNPSWTEIPGAFFAGESYTNDAVGLEKYFRLARAP